MSFPMSANLVVVKASHIKPFIDFLDAKNAPVDNLLKQVNMNREQFSCPDNLVPEPPFWAFLELVVTELGISDIGF